MAEAIAMLTLLGAGSSSDGGSSLNPGSIGLSSKTDSEITVESVSDASGGVPPYTLDAYLDDVLFDDDISLPYTYSGLDSGTEYDLSVRVTSSDSQQDFTNELVVSTDWSPSALSGLVISPIVSVMRAASRLWQDDGKTTPASANANPVRRAGDTFTSAEIASLSDAGRPVLTSLPSSDWSLAFDGSNDELGPLHLGSPNGLFSYHVVKTSVVGYHNIYDSFNYSGGANLWVDNFGRFMPNNQAGLWDAGAVITDGVWHTVFVWQSTTDSTRLWIDNVEITPSVGGFVGAAPTDIDLFSRGGTASFNGQCAGFGFATVLPNSTNRNLLQSYLEGLAS